MILLTQRCIYWRIVILVYTAQSPGVKPKTPLVWAARALPRAHNSRMTTNLYFHFITSKFIFFPAWSKMLWKFRVKIPLSMCISWWRKIFSQPPTKFWRHILSGCQVCNWGIQYHLCSTYRGLWGLVIVQLSWLSGRALAAPEVSWIQLLVTVLCVPLL